MKHFLIVAGLLMTGASVYGVVDYNKKAKTEAFKELYKEKPSETETPAIEMQTPIKVADKQEINTVIEPTKKVEKKVMYKKKTKEERVFRIREFSRGKLG